MAPTAVALALTLWQFDSSPREQKKHVPHEMWKGTITLSPGRRFCTEGPTCSTWPMNSWPKVCPIRVSGSSP